ncbi:MAG: hypothetical protein KDA42_10700, partial [Planctomycetales bacterium]|nr:hypothetical protein [Planctomycetales bacterium]
LACRDRSPVSSGIFAPLSDDFKSTSCVIGFTFVAVAEGVTCCTTDRETHNASVQRTWSASGD